MEVPVLSSSPPIPSLHFLFSSQTVHHYGLTQEHSPWHGEPQAC